MSETITENEFLHDVANLFTIAHGHMMLLEMQTKKGHISPEESLVKIEKSLAALGRIQSLIVKRRAQITSEGGKDVKASVQSEG
jgi:hypothetical protein